MRILGSVSKTIGIVKQISPIVNDMKPLFSKIPKMVERLSEIRNVTYNLRPSNLNNIVNTSITNPQNQLPNNNLGPTFFQ